MNVDPASEKLGYRLRNAQLKKVPYTLVIGDNERDNGTITYRKFGQKEQVTVSVEEFLKMILDEIKNRKNNL